MKRHVPSLTGLRRYLSHCNPGKDEISHCCSVSESSTSHGEEINSVIPAFCYSSAFVFPRSTRLKPSLRRGSCFTLIPLTSFSTSLISTFPLTCFPARTPFCRAQADSVLRPFTTSAPGTSLQNTQQGVHLPLHLNGNTNRF